MRISTSLSRVGVQTALAALFLVFASATSLRAASAPKPNIVIILADDMGFSDAGCYGSEIHTPNLDKLADSGIRFTNFYNTARCWSSRAALLTGYYAQQVRRDTIPGVSFPTGTSGVRPAWARLLPAMLQPLGYRCYHSGKWHIDGPRLKAGFDRSYCLIDTDRYFYPKNHLEDDVRLPPVKPGDGYYTTTAIADHAIKYLKEHEQGHRDQPFFLYLAFTSPHFPLQAPAEDIAKYKGRYDAGWDVMREARWKRMRELGIVDCALSDRDAHTIPSWNLPESALQKRIGPGEVGYAVPWNSLTAEQKAFQSAKMSVHAAMVDRMDQEIGRVLQQLSAMGADDNTIVVFLSDNGASAEQIIRGDGEDPAAPVGSAKSFLGIGPGWSTMCNTPLRLHKSWVHEGGISTPLIVRWPQGIAARGELRRNPGHLIDLAPTLLELAGGQWPSAWGDVKVPPPPGKSLAPVFTKDGTVSHDYFWWFHEGHRAVRVGDWKAVSLGVKAPWELYNLSNDRSEMHDLAKENPEKASELAKLWQQKMDEFRELASRDMPAGKAKAAAPKTRESKPEAD
ncbi:MAG TPA: arylsulfatase [Tepidisphaeraceae bacterium]|nr:arylsulfatase [Tepidisphaeraceae bacterium]